MKVRKNGAAWVLRLETGDEVIGSLTTWAEASGIGFASVQAIGALQEAVLGYFDSAEREYRRLPIREHVEVVSLLGSLSRGEDGAPVAHVHAVLGYADGTTLGGHLFEGIVGPTLEVVIFPLPEEIRRKKDPETGLALLDV
ncbi:MAG TPA: DUF296 domain-containing protein [Anaerolineales bacterium]|nr:DUF296 domain-containing protein [Anaerolineae bacterium]HIP88288.1 DUF296 domain-containing protein [Anaerolineales bacterium]